ncbi:MAG: MFS transporter [Tepidisphaeraceae bacterium]
MTAATVASEPSRLAFMLRALKSRNYRLFFAGQLVSLIGSWLTTVAISWLVYRLTGSAFLLGLAGFAGQFPTFIGAPFTGALVDRWPLRRTLVITQTLAMLQSFGLAAIVLTGHETYGAILSLAVFQGFINAFDIPTRQAFVVQMLDDRADLPNAIALNSSMVNGARLLGPSAAGILIAAFGEGLCFFIDGVSYIFVIIALLMMTVAKRAAPKEGHPPVLESIKEGFEASFGFAPIRAVLLLLALVSLAGVPYMVLMPVFAKEILHGGPGLLGVLTGAAGVGALCGGVYLASRRSVVGISRALVTAAITFGVALVAFGFSRSIPVSILIMPIAGASMIIEMAGTNTLIQTLAEDHQRGRVMAMFTMCFMGTVPIGSLICGLVADHFGAPITVMAGGVMCIAGGIVFNAARPKLRPLVTPIYIRRGILPEIAEGMRTASTATDNIAG